MDKNQYSRTEIGNTLLFNQLVFITPRIESDSRRRIDFNFINKKGRDFSRPLKTKKDFSSLIRNNIDNYCSVIETFFRSIIIKR